MISSILFFFHTLALFSPVMALIRTWPVSCEKKKNIKNFIFLRGFKKTEILLNEKNTE